MVLGLLEIVLIGGVSYLTLGFVISLLVRDKFPETPAQAGMRIGLAIPGIVGFFILATAAVGTDAATASEVALFTVTFQDAGSASTSLPFDQVPIEITRQASTHYEATIDNMTNPTGAGSQGAEQLREFTLISDPGLWIVWHLIGAGVLVAFILYQFGMIFQRMFA